MPINSVAVIFRDFYTGTVLLSERLPPKSQAGKLQAPCGKVEEGECSEEAAIREVFEETGIWIPSSKIHFFKEDPKPEGCDTCKYYIVDVDFAITPVNREPEKQTDWKLVSLKEIRTLPKEKFLGNLKETILDCLGSRYYGN